MNESVAFTALTFGVSGVACTCAIDGAYSTLTVYVYTTGLLSSLAHNHEIKVPID
jgi:hypothetical protein